MLLILGDSKSNNAPWATLLRLNVNAAGLPGGFLPSIYNYAISFQTLAMAITASLPNVVAMADETEVKVCWLNWGANDWNGGLPDEATWKADMLTVVDTVQGKWPGARIFITRPWERGKYSESDVVAGWIADIIALRTNVFPGDDERDWLEGGDNGDTMTSDGTHYSAAGQTAAALAKQAAMA